MNLKRIKTFKPNEYPRWVDVIAIAIHSEAVEEYEQRNNKLWIKWAEGGECTFRKPMTALIAIRGGGRQKPKRKG